MLALVRGRCRAGALLPYVRVCYGGVAPVYVGKSVVLAKAGVHHGEPLGPLLFALAILSIHFSSPGHVLEP